MFVAQGAVGGDGLLSARGGRGRREADGCVDAAGRSVFVLAPILLQHAAQSCIARMAEPVSVVRPIAIPDADNCGATFANRRYIYVNNRSGAVRCLAAAILEATREEKW